MERQRLLDGLHGVVLHPRLATLADALPAASCAYPNIGISLEHGAREIRRVLASPYGVGVIVEHKGSLLGILTGSLLSRSFSKLIIEADEPYVHPKLAEHPSPFPSEAQVGEANFDGGLDLYLTHFGIYDGLNTVDYHTVIEQLIKCFMEQFAGFRIRQILIEPSNLRYARLLEVSGFQIINAYQTWSAVRGLPPEFQPALMSMTATRALESGNYQLFGFLSYRPPICLFPAKARELLNWAMRDVADADLIERGILSKSTVTSRWNRIFEIAESAGVIPEGPRRDRTKLLAYLRKHPEELRPYTMRKRARRESKSSKR